MALSLQRQVGTLLIIGCNLEAALSRIGLVELCDRLAFLESLQMGQLGAPRHADLGTGHQSRPWSQAQASSLPLKEVSARVPARHCSSFKNPRGSATNYPAVSPYISSNTKSLRMRPRSLEPLKSGQGPKFLRVKVGGALASRCILFQNI